jgi:hypothetical protein
MVASGAGIKPGDRPRALHREPFDAGDVPCPSTRRAAVQDRSGGALPREALDAADVLLDVPRRVLSWPAQTDASNERRISALTLSRTGHSKQRSFSPSAEANGARSGSVLPRRRQNSRARALRLKTSACAHLNLLRRARVVCARTAKVKESAMPKFVIEREIAGAGKLPRQKLQAISRKSCSVLHDMGPQIQWVQSYVTDDKIYCAPDEDALRTHARKGGFPANTVAHVRAVIDPTTAEVAEQKP